MNFLISNFVNDYRERSARGFEGRDTLTPVDLARAMGRKLFEQLPDDPEKLKKMTFVDPACGTGIFGAVVADYLYKRLEPAISDDEKRIRHIACEQIWMYDKSLTQVKVARELFPDFFEPKIIQKDTLNEEWPMKFDVAIGNPPYESEKRSGYGTSGKKNLYREFILKTKNSLKEHGYLSFICPPAFLKTTVWGEKTEYFEPFVENNFIYYNPDVSEYFKSGTPICHFVLQKSENESSNVVNVKGEYNIDMSGRSFLPRILNEKTLSVIDKVSSFEKNLNFQRDDSGYSGDDPFVGMKRYNHISSSGSMNVKVNDPDVNLYFDLRERSHSPEDIKTLLESELFRYLNIVCRYDAVIYHYFINGFTYPEELEAGMSDKEIYGIYNLDESEIREVKSVLND